MLNNKKIGLALGGGAAKGLAHIGVLEVLEIEGIEIDMVAGTSMGALIGAIYAKGKDIEEMKELATYWGKKNFSLFSDPTLPITSLVKGKKIEDMLKSIIGNIEFKDLKIPFACVATDIWNGDEVVIKQGLVWEAVRASGSIPVIFKPIERDGNYLVDGGLVNTVPVSVLREMGADFVIAVNVASNVREYSPGANDEDIEVKIPNIFNVIMQVVHIANHHEVKSSMIGADVIIEPAVAHIGWSSLQRAPEYILQGAKAARKCLPDILKKLV